MRPFLLVADDYALSPGVSAGIETLAAARRLSGTAAITTLPGWGAAGARVARLRQQIALGLHLNLTLGAPLGPMPGHAPGGILPPVEGWILRAWTGRIDTAEVEEEIERQFARFEAVAGAAPDYVDGHHHVHALPGVRAALLRVIARRYPRGAAPLLRLPGDRPRRILARGGAWPKALVLALATAGARAAFHRADAPVNDGFAGFSGFDRSLPFARELARFAQAPGPRHLVMCHPGHADAALAALDPLSARREDEFAALMADATLPARIHHPAATRDTDGRIDWRRLAGPPGGIAPAGRAAA